MKDWIIEKIAGLFAPKYVGSFVRAGLQVLAGALISLGIQDTQVAAFTVATEPVLTGVIMALGTLGWSLFQKHKKSD